MNKLRMSIVKLDHDLKVLEIKNNVCYIIKENLKIKKIIFPKEKFTSKIIILEEKKLLCNSLCTIKNTSGNLIIEPFKKAQVFINLGIKAYGKNNLEIKNILKNNNIHSEIKIRIIGGKNSKTFLTATGIIEEETKDNFFLEDIKYLYLEDSYILCEPILKVASDSCIANHFLTMGSITKEELFYLETKGINSKKASDLIKKCFLKSMLGGE